jgi:hypothetical protein
MSARWKRLGSIAIIGLGMTVTAFGQNKPPAEQDVAAAIARGVTFLKEAQSREGYWNEPAQAQHQLGMTALAGLALLENGIPRESREIGKARELVTALASQSDQTYDIALAILFLARCQEGRRGESDALIQSLGRSRGDLGLQCSSQRRRIDDSPWKSAARSAAQGRANWPRLRDRRRQFQYPVRAPGPVGLGPARL